MKQKTKLSPISLLSLWACPCLVASFITNGLPLVHQLNMPPLSSNMSRIYPHFAKVCLFVQLIVYDNYLMKLTYQLSEEMRWNETK